jgi:hypothetical protein
LVLLKKRAFGNRIWRRCRRLLAGCCCFNVPTIKIENDE